MSKAKKQGSCIFCGSFGLTKQHILPDWIKTVLPRMENLHNQRLVSYSNLDSEIKTTSLKATVNQGHIGVKKIRNVCANCNGGWMSDIEQTVKPFLSQMMLGKTVRLTPEHKFELAKWVVMTSIMAEFTDLTHMAIPSSHRKTLFEMGHPDFGWKIWVGRYFGDEWDYRYKHLGTHVMTIEESKKMRQNTHSLPSNCQSTTFVLGDLFIHAVTLLDLLWDKFTLNKYQSKLIQIWPPNPDQDDIWPPFDKISDGDATEISDLFKQKYF